MVQGGNSRPRPNYFFGLGGVRRTGLPVMRAYSVRASWWSVTAWLPFFLPFEMKLCECLPGWTSSSAAAKAAGTWPGLYPGLGTLGYYLLPFQGTNKKQRYPHVTLGTLGYCLLPFRGTIRAENLITGLVNLGYYLLPFAGHNNLLIRGSENAVCFGGPVFISIYKK